MNFWYDYLIVLTVMLAINYYLIVVKHRSPNHELLAGARMMAFAIFAFFGYEDWTSRVVLFLGFNAAFGLPFDTILNKLRHLDWDYIGKTAWTDRTFRQWPVAFFWVRLILFIMGAGAMSYNLTTLNQYAN